MVKIRKKDDLWVLLCVGRNKSFYSLPLIFRTLEDTQLKYLIWDKVSLKTKFQAFFFKFFLFIYLYIFGCAGSSVRARAFSSCGKWGPLFIAVRGPLTTAAPPAAGHRLQTHRLSSCGSRAQPLRGMWDLPRPGLEPVSPALAGRFSTTAPPGKPYYIVFYPHVLK